MNYPDEEPRVSPSEISEFPKSLDIATVSIYGLSILSAGMFCFFPFINLFHPSPWQRSLGLIHSIGAMLTTVFIVYVGHLSFPLLRGNRKILPQVRTLTFWSTVITALGIVTGNLVYMRYRADLNFGGAQAWLKENSPLTQYLLSSYHGLTSLFLLPLGVSCTWILWQYGDSITEKHNRPVLAAVSIGVMGMMFFAMGGFVSGLGIAKIHAL